MPESVTRLVLVAPFTITHLRDTDVGLDNCSAVSPRDDVRLQPLI